MTQGITAYYRDGYEQRRRIMSLRNPAFWPLAHSMAMATVASGETRLVDKNRIELQVGNVIAPLHDCVEAGITMDMLK